MMTMGKPEYRVAERNSEPFDGMAEFWGKPICLEVKECHPAVADNDAHIYGNIWLLRGQRGGGSLRAHGTWSVCIYDPEIVAVVAADPDRRDGENRLYYGTCLPIIEEGGRVPAPAEAQFTLVGHTAPGVNAKWRAKMARTLEDRLPPEGPVPVRERNR